MRSLINILYCGIYTQAGHNAKKKMCVRVCVGALFLAMILASIRKTMKSSLILEA